ncbi:unknown [Prevotella sp. CAG:891]|nr:unknown [Prevotella sp. CAG:891]
MSAPRVATNTTSRMFMGLSGVIDRKAAGGTTTSEGKGMNELSMVMNTNTHQ